jgi:glutathione S-transferase
MTSDAVKDHARASVARALSVLAAQLESCDTLLGASFSVADAYLLWAMMLTRPAEISLDPYPALKRYLKRHAARPAVAEAVAFEREQQARPFAA